MCCCVLSLGLSNAIEEQQVDSAAWDMPMLGSILLHMVEGTGTTSSPLPVLFADTGGRAGRSRATGTRAAAGGGGTAGASSAAARTTAAAGAAAAGRAAGSSAPQRAAPAAAGAVLNSGPTLPMGGFALCSS